MTNRLSRRRLLGATAATAAAGLLPLPAFHGSARAQAGTLRLGVPTAVTGTWAPLGAQVVRTSRLFAKTVNAEGGIDGRKVEFLIEDTQGVPANCLRKAQEMVEREKVNILLGLMASSEALAVMPKLAEWNALFISSINGAGSMTAEAYVPNMFRANTSGPMGARAIALWLEDQPATEFFSLSLDYAWGHSSVEVFEKLITGMGKKAIGKVFAPVGTKDYSTYIARVRQANPQALYVALTGDDGTAFLRQAAQYRLGEKVQIVTELVDLLNVKPVGESAVGLVGSSRYTFAYDTPANVDFVKRFTAEYGEVPDTFDGEHWQSLQLLAAAIRKAGSTDTKALIQALEGMELTSVKGPIKVRACDHQAEQQGFVVRVEKRDGYPHPIPVVIKTYPAARVTPECRKASY
ncbi:MAG: ABC transporter substrate-binding protein [Alphaproteobacteria bacterium]|nr:ABC transporter substrate-binding protein [Alphaproteobacteria bacterium]